MNYRIDTADVREWHNEGLYSAILCDPPYELSFMGRSWDSTGVAFQPETWAHLAQFLHPGAFIMAFGGSRTAHRLACAIEDAGFIIHPTIGWVYGSGFPKATRIDTQIDKAAGAEREVVGKHRQTMPQISPRANFGERFGDEGENNSITAPAMPLAQAWEAHRYGLQALKPALEMIVVAQKPYAGKPVDCITETGAGALNVEQSRIRQTGPGHDAGAYKLRVQPDDSDDRLHPSFESCLGALRHIVSVLRGHNTDGTSLLHNEDGQDDKMQEAASCDSQPLAHLFPNGSWCGLDLMSALDSLSDCQPYHHLYGELLHQAQGAAQDGAPSLADALERICKALSEPLHSPDENNDLPSNAGVQNLALSLCQLLMGDLIVSTVPQLALPVKSGRWPANFALCHSPECKRIGTKRVKGAGSSGGYPNGPGGHRFKFDPSPNEGNGYQGYGDPDGLETIDAWECVESCGVRRLGEQSGERRSAGLYPSDSIGTGAGTTYLPTKPQGGLYADTGTAARFFFQADWNLEQADPFMYCAKAGRKERDAGLEGMEAYYRGTMGAFKENPGRTVQKGGGNPAHNPHPTVKPIALCKWLATLLLPPVEYAPRRILIPFAGSGSECIGAGLAGWDEVVGIEREAEYVAIAEARLAHWMMQETML